MVLLSFGTERVENNSGLDASNATHRIDLKDARHVLREVEDDGRVTALPGKGRTAAACEQRSAVVAAKGKGRENVFFVAGNYDTDRNLAVIGAVGRVEGAAARIKANFSAKVAAESGFERRDIELLGLGRRWRNVLRHRVQNIFEDAGVGCKGSHLVWRDRFPVPLCDPCGRHFF
jgi:hypothetical protein